MLSKIAGAMLAAIAVIVLGSSSGAFAAPRASASDMYLGAVPGTVSADFYDHAKGEIKDQ